MLTIDTLGVAFQPAIDLTTVQEKDFPAASHSSQLAWLSIPATIRRTASGTSAP
jgi:hypothetical protein